MNGALALVSSLLLSPALAVAAPSVAPGTHFKIVAFGENDPRKDDTSLVGADCIAEGDGLQRYSEVPLHYGIATCGDSPMLIDFLAIQIEIAGAETKATPAPKATPKPKATKTPKGKATPKPKAAKAELTKIDPGTKFIVLEFGENDPLRDGNLVGETCVADGFLLKYKQSPFFYGTAKCGDETVDLLAVRVRLVDG